MMKKRFVTLDVMRGLTVAFMCLVNNPGTWSKIYPPLTHAEWFGCTPTDLVFPFFVFCMGCAMAFSLSKYDSLTKESSWKILKRGLLIIAVGLLLNLYPFYPYSPHDESWTFGQNYLYWLQHKRLFGVLQRIGLCYIIGGLIILGFKKHPGKIALAGLGLMIIYTAVLVIFKGPDGGPFSVEGTFASEIDKAIVGENHMYRRYLAPNGERYWFDPEGLWGSLTGACTVILGFLAGTLVRNSQKSYAALPTEKDSPIGVVARLFFASALSLAAAMIMSIWIPICKALWTPSYVLYAGGWALFVLAFLSYLIDVKGYERFFTPAKAFGMNALAAFVLSGVIAKTFGWIGWSPSRYFTANEFTSLVYAILFVLVIFSISWILYKKKIVIKL
ncbi:MAG: DUF1624 domain-containing protein [Bacteroidales bacterium]|nr:DUF1624 domain-containing protein [Bacteroidales bacterium]MBQ2550541.1 DUF1624 domain-containing protein [Bacteroidales bacterium]